MRIIDLWHKITGVSEIKSLLQAKGTSIDKIIASFGSTTTNSGVPVNPESMMSITAVWRAINILAETIAALPFEVIKMDKDRNTMVDYDHPVYTLLNSEPSILYTSFTFRHTMMVHALIWGNAYAIIKRDPKTKIPTQFIIIEPDRMNIFLDEQDNLIYQITDIAKNYAARDVIHIRNTSWNGLAGLNIMEIQSESFGLALANMKYGSNFYRAGAHLSGVLEHPGRLTQDAYERLRTSWKKRYEGVNAEDSTAILEEGMQYKPVGLKPNDASFIETKKISVADVSRIFGVPQFLLEDLDRATFNNIEHLSLLFLKHTIWPWCTRIEQEFTRKCFGLRERKRTKAKFQIDALQLTDMESWSKYLNTLFKWGMISVNEGRRMRGMNPIENGDTHLVPLNMQDIGQSANPNSDEEE